MDNKPVRIVAEEKAHPNLRKLARALISLARRELDEQPPKPKPRRRSKA